MCHLNTLFSQCHHLGSLRQKLFWEQDICTCDLCVGRRLAWPWCTFEHIWELSSVQLLSHVWLFVTPWPAACQASLSITNSRSSPKPMSIESVMPSYHLILCHPLLLLPSIFPSIRVFTNESFLCIRWPKYWSFSFSIRSSNEYSGLTSFRIDWFDLFAVQGILKSLLQDHRKYQFFGTQPSLWSNSHTIHDYWKNHSFD